MSVLAWSDDLVTGHERIDADHKLLVELSGVIKELIDRGDSPDLLRQKLKVFYKQLIIHCAYEESLIRTLPQEEFGQHVDQHCRQHEVLIGHAKALLDAAGNSKDDLLIRSNALVALMKDLIIDDFTLVSALTGSSRKSAHHIELADEKNHLPPRASIGMHLAATVAAVVLLMAIFLGYSVYETTARVEGEIRNTAHALLSGMVNEVSGVFETNKEVLRRMAERPMMRAPDQNICDPILKDFKEIFPKFANLTTIEPNGVALCSAVPQPGGKPVNVFKSEWFQREIAQNKFVVGKPFMGPITGRWVSVLTLPVYDAKGQVIRYMGLPLDLVAFAPSLGKAPLLPGTTIGILTSDGIFVWRNLDTENWVGKSVDNHPALVNFVEHGIAETQGTGVDGTQRTYYLDKIPEADWIVFVGVPTSTMRDLLAKIIPPALLLGTLALLVVAAISFMMTRRIAKPIRELAETARAIQRGEVNARASLGGPSEVADVAREFNALIDQRDRQTAELTRSNVELERFAHIASHDLQEPVRTVVAYSQLLERRYAGHFDAEGHEYLNFIVVGAKRMGDLVRDLLAYSQFSRSARVFAAVSFAEVVKDTLSSLQQLIQQSGAAIEVDEANMPVVQGDRIQLMELVQNLIVNAIRFAKPGVPPLLRIAARSNLGNVVLTFTDNGIGIEKSYWEQIFIIFKRLHGSNYPGTGIGLAICKQIVEGHGGRIWVESTPGEGSTFFVLLPQV